MSTSLEVAKKLKSGNSIRKNSASSMENPIVLHLRAEFLRRMKANRSYSLRAFAAGLDIPSGRLSEILSGKRKLSKKLSHKLVFALPSTPVERSNMLLYGTTANLKPILGEEFECISDPLHFAVLTLMETRNFKSNASWIARRLGEHVEQIRDVLARLEKLQLIRKERNSLMLSQNGLTTSNEIPSSALRNSHKNLLERSINALETAPVEMRDITSILLAIDPADLPLLKDKIRKFRRELLAITEGRKKKEVYSLQIQLIPISKNVSKETFSA